MSTEAEEQPAADWRVVEPVRGFWRSFDAFFGPGMTAREWWVLWIGTLGSCGAIVALWVQTDALATFSLAGAVWALVASFDVFGGIMTLATNSGKRWYNSPAQRGTRHRLAFLSLHVAHLAVIAFVTLGTAVAPTVSPWVWFGVNVALLLTLGAAITLSPLDIQRPVAFVALLAAIFVNLIVVPVPAALAYFAPLFFVKLFVCYLPLETPWRTRPPGPQLPGSRRRGSS